DFPDLSSIPCLLIYSHNLRTVNGPTGNLWIFRTMAYDHFLSCRLNCLSRTNRASSSFAQKPFDQSMILTHSWHIVSLSDCLFTQLKFQV
ncbi:hypothetical protein MTR67_011937, partial [Solanum verrucosum]